MTDKERKARNDARRARNAAISETLTATPQWVAEWEEWAAVDGRGWTCTASTAKFCADIVKQNNEVAARHARTEQQVAQ